MGLWGGFGGYTQTLALPSLHLLFCHIVDNDPFPLFTVIVCSSYEAYLWTNSSETMSRGKTSDDADYSFYVVQCPFAGVYFDGFRVFPGQPGTDIVVYLCDRRRIGDIDGFAFEKVAVSENFRSFCDGVAALPDADHA